MQNLEAKCVAGKGGSLRGTNPCEEREKGEFWEPIPH